jgi:WD40 repeat protein
MRTGLLSCVALILTATFAWDQEKPPAMQPIKVVALDRKEPPTFEKDIEPILVKKCTFCHSGNVKEGKFDMGSFETLMKGGKHGKPIVPGKSAESLLIKSAGKTERPFMPPKTETPLTPEELAVIKLWIEQGAKPPSGARVRTAVTLHAPPATVHPVQAVAISPDKSAVAVGRGNEIHIYDAGSGTYVRSLLDPKLTSDQKPLRTAHLALVESLAYSPDGKFLVSGAYQEVNIWDAQSGLLRQKLTGFADRVVAVAFSANGKLLATGGGAPTEDGEIKVFEMPSGKQLVDIKNGHSDTVFGVAFSPDGTKLATGAADKFVKVFEIPSGKFLKSFEGHTNHVLDVGWKADGKLIVSAGAESPTALGAGVGIVKVWDYEKGEQVRTIPAHGRQVTRLAFVGNTSQFVTCSGDQGVKLWNADNGGNLRNFGGSTDYVYAVGVSPDGAVVAAGGEEGVVRLYNGQNAQLIKTLTPPGTDATQPKK